MKPKDYFSEHSKIYATFRPSYPQELYDFIFQMVGNKLTAWDCATGNGQVAKILSQHFKKVFATDISKQQLENAFKADNIFYRETPAELTTFSENQFDLITVGQALHWFNVDAFYKEVKRVGKNKGVLAVWGYSLCSINNEVDKILNHYYYNIVGPYWDSARKLVEEEYRNLPFPFEQINAPRFEIKVQWSLQQFIGYLTSWSATQQYIKATAHDPTIDIKEELLKFWPSNKNLNVVFPLFIKVGNVSK